jgi:hypothetical protein
MRKLLIPILLLVPVVAVAERFTASATIVSNWNQLDVTWVVSDSDLIYTGLNSSNTVVYCSGSVYGMTASGELIDAVASGMVGLGETITWTLQTTSSDPFVTSWTDVSCG